MIIPRQKPVETHLAPRWMGVERQLEHLYDPDWVLSRMGVLLSLQAEGKVVVSDEGYLRHPDYPVRGFARTVVMSGWVDSLLDGGVVGAKFVSSRPENTKEGLPRGQAVTILNDGATGLPKVVFDGTMLSNARTAAFAAWTVLSLRTSVTSIALVGAGRVHSLQALYMRHLWPHAELMVCDIDPEQVEAFAARSQATPVPVARAFEADVVSLATAGAPDGWITDPAWVRANQVWVNTSLRDVAPEFFKEFPTVVVDDVALAMSQPTPFRDAVQSEWVEGLVAACDLREQAEIEFPVIVNPMGMAAWDVGLGAFLYEDLLR